MDSYVVKMKHIEKNFANVKAVVDASFNLIEGEIHSLIGENGAGKSTMMKLLYGMYPLEKGEIFINGEHTKQITPKIAIEHGIGMLHQEFMLVNELTVLENIILGFEPKRGFFIDFAKAQEMIQHYIDHYHMDVQVKKRIDQISVGEAQRVEIIKILSRGANTIILDEPTGVLTPQETRKLFEILQSLKSSGKSIVFISHKLNEVMEISDRITVMRSGRVIQTVKRADTNTKELSRMMVGREVFLDIKRKKSEIGKPVLRVSDLWTSGEKELSKIRGISFEVNAGEILGVAGVDGNGQSELIEAITGLREVERGKVELDGMDITNKSPRYIRDKGLAHIPSERNKMGLNRSASVMDNMAVTRICREPFSRFKFILNKHAIKQSADELVAEFDVRPPNAKANASELSGGNAQKVVVAREVSQARKLLVAAQPTRGIDIGAIESIRTILQEVKAQGIGVLLVSTELDEILSLADRIIVMSEGTISGSMAIEEANREQIGLLMLAGGKDRQRGEAS